MRCRQAMNVMLYLIGILLFLPGLAQSLRVFPFSTSTTVPPSASLARGATNIFLRLQQQLTNATDPDVLYPEQVRLTPWAPGQMLVSWVTRKASVLPLLNCTISSAQAQALPRYASANVSYLQLGTQPGVYTRVISGHASTYNVTMHWNPTATEPTKQSPLGMAGRPPPVYSAVFYRSGLIHHALADVQPATKYYYRVGDGQHWSPEYHFTALGRSKSQWPLRIGVMADTSTSHQTYGVMAIHQALQPHVLLHLGDITYADRYNTPDAWDAFTRMASSPASRRPLFPHIPSLFNVGNHEVETPACRPRATLGEFPYFVAMNARLPSPRPPFPPEPGQPSPPPSLGPLSNRSTSSDPRSWNPNAGVEQSPEIDTSYSTSRSPRAAAANQYYSVDLPGAHLIFLSSYVFGDQFTPDSPQYRWLESDLEAVNRTVTPWLIVSFHEAWYTSFRAHYKENECMRVAYEPLLTKHRVDVYLHGHVHAYERTHPISNYTLTPDGGVHLSVGNGGTLSDEQIDYMDLTCPLQMPLLKQPQFHPWLPATCMVSLQYLSNGTACRAPESSLAQACAQCSTGQPAWSAYRESEYGSGMLTILNETTAYWEYFRNTDNVPADDEHGIPHADNLTAADWVYIHR